MEESLRALLGKLVNMPNKELEIVDFDKGGNGNEKAYLNWMTSNKSNHDLLQRQAEPYMVSAKILSEICLIDNSDRKADTWIFPILSLFCQGYELYLKAIRSILCLLSKKNDTNDNQNISNNQDIFDMLTILSYDIKEIAERDLKKIEIVFNNLAKSCNLKDASELPVFAKTPINKENEIFEALEQRENVTINVRALTESIEAVACLLQRIYDCLDKVLECKLENQEI